MRSKDFIPADNGLPMLKSLEQLKGGAVGAALYSLIDGAKFRGLAKIPSPADGSVARYPLLGDSAQHDAVDVGPMLIRHERREYCPLLIKLLNTAGSGRFLSLILSPAPLPYLLERLRWLTDVEHDDGTEWIMRYYDPVILPHWLRILDVAQREIVVRGLSAWVYIDARGVPQIVYGETNAVLASPGSKPMLLNQHQCDELMNKTLPYLMMHQLESDDAQALTTLPLIERYDFFSIQLTKAHSYGLMTPTDLKTYCMLALMVGADFDSTKLATSTLNRVNAKTSFSELVLNWGPEQWMSLEEDTLLVHMK